MSRPSSKGPVEKAEFSHRDNASSTAHEGDGIDEKTRHMQLVNAKLANPLMGMSKMEILTEVEAFAKDHGLDEFTDTLKKGALVAANPTGNYLLSTRIGLTSFGADFESIEELNDEDRNVLRREITHKWSQPKVRRASVL